MIFKNAMSFKAKIKQIANANRIHPQQAQQLYLIEAFLCKLAQSQYKDNFIVKGGFLIGGLVGIDARTTMDLDTTITGFSLTAEQLQTVVSEILEIDTEESFKFSVSSIEEIREKDDYPGLRIHLQAVFETIHELVSIDVTTGDVITPRETEYGFRSLLNNEEIELLTYPIETVLAEKLETILSRNIYTTRARDYYDVYVLKSVKSGEIHIKTLQKALIYTCQKRGSASSLNNYRIILESIKVSQFQRQLWTKYRKQYVYASALGFEEVIASINALLDVVMGN